LVWRGASSLSATHRIPTKRQVTMNMGIPTLMSVALNNEAWVPPIIPCRLPLGAEADVHGALIRGCEQRFRMRTDRLAEFRAAAGGRFKAPKLSLTMDAWKLSTRR